MIGLVDGNNFYCSCERLFDPSLNGRPLVVLSNNDGCVIARSDEAKALGIVMGTPAHAIRPLLEKEKVAVFSSNYTLYGDMSDRVMSTMAALVPRMEIYSIDEAFVDFGDDRPADLTARCASIREQVGRDTGIPISIGVAPNKTLAKMANRYAKKRYKERGFFCMHNEELREEVLRATAVDDTWGIGKQYAGMLRRRGFKTAYDFSHAPADWVQKQFSVVGLRLHRELNGERCHGWEEGPARKKNIRTSRAFGQFSQDKEVLAEALSNHTAATARKLRQEGSCCRKLSVFVMTNQFRTQDRQYAREIRMALEVPSADTPELIRYALKGLDIIYKPGFNYVKCGVEVSDLVAEESVQKGMFDQRDRGRTRKLLATMDEVNQCLGQEALRFAVQGFEKRYRLRNNYLSRCYTTRIEEVIEVKN